jgi:Mn-dependent DtxR family transcriptional regulator
MKRFESKEDYLEKILQLSCEKDVVHSIDIARAMNFSKPSVSVAMGKLKEEKLIEIDNLGHIHLTPTGLAIAEKTLEKHELLAKMFMNLGVPESIAYEDACRVEHDISDETWEAIKKHAKLQKAKASEHIK